MREEENDFEVVVIGAGASGLAALNSMLAYGFKKILAIEKENSIGGVWYTTNYPNLKIHSKSYNYKFADFHAVKSKTDRATRAEILTYFEEYALAKGLLKHIRFKCLVKKIIYHQERLEKKCEVWILDLKTNKEFMILSNIVICAQGFTFGGNFHLPKFNGQETFKGKIVHSSQFTEVLHEEVLMNNKKIIVLGAGKSSHELLSLFPDEKIKNVTWIYTKTLWASCYEKFYTKTYLVILLYMLLLQKLRKKFRQFNWFLYALERPIVWSGLMINPIETSSDIYNMRFAVMTTAQYHHLKKINKIKASIDSINATHVVLSNGESLKADYIICATGYEQGSNLPPIIITDKEGKSTAYDPRLQHTFFRCMINPEIPEIAIFTSEPIFPQLIFGFSIAAEWLARFYKGKLNENISLNQMKNELENDKKILAKKWCNPNIYLSKGTGYGLHLNYPYDFITICQEIGIQKNISWRIACLMGIEEYFNKLCETIKRKIEAYRNQLEEKVK